MQILCNTCGLLPLPPTIPIHYIEPIDLNEGAAKEESSNLLPLKLLCKRCKGPLFFTYQDESFSEPWWTEEDLEDYIIYPILLTSIPVEDWCKPGSIGGKTEVLKKDFANRTKKAFATHTIETENDTQTN